jgi:hypothetical protein
MLSVIDIVSKNPSVFRDVDDASFHALPLDTKAPSLSPVTDFLRKNPP